MTNHQHALFQVRALVVDGDRRYVDAATAVPLATTAERHLPLHRRFLSRIVLEIRDREGAVVLAVGWVPPGVRPHRPRIPVFWPDGSVAGTIWPKGVLRCDFRLCGPGGELLAVAERARSWRPQESYDIRDTQGLRIATMVEPVESITAMESARPPRRSLRVEFTAQPTPWLRALTLALPLAVRMRYDWDRLGM